MFDRPGEKGYQGWVAGRDESCLCTNKFMQLVRFPSRGCLGESIFETEVSVTHVVYWVWCEAEGDRIPAAKFLQEACRTSSTSPFFVGVRILR